MFVCTPQNPLATSESNFDNSQLHTTCWCLPCHAHPYHRLCKTCCSGHFSGANSRVNSRGPATISSGKGNRKWRKPSSILFLSNHQRIIWIKISSIQPPVTTWRINVKISFKSVIPVIQYPGLRLQTWFRWLESCCKAELMGLMAGRQGSPWRHRCGVIADPASRSLKGQTYPTTTRL